MADGRGRKGELRMMKYKNSNFAFLLPSAVLLLILRKRPQQARRVAEIDTRLCDVFFDHSAGSHYDRVTDRNRQDRRVRSDADAVANLCPLPEFLVSAGRTATCKKVVDEHRSVRNETIVANHDQLANEGVRLDPRPFSYPHPLLNFDKRSDKGFIINFTSVKVDRLNDG